MIPARPRSVLGLLVIGFTLVAVPLIWAVYEGARYVEQLARQSEALVLHSVQVTRESRRIDALIGEMERNAALYIVLNDVQLLASYDEKLTRFRGSLKALEALDIDDTMGEELPRMRAESENIARWLAERPPTPDATEEQRRQEIRDTFAGLRAKAHELGARNTRHIDERVTALQRTASQARQSLFWLTAALIPVTVVLMISITILIARPIRQLGRAIHRLGEGSLAERVSVGGPAELSALGNELDWLRRRLIELEQEKNVFLRQMSHELKTPLASIREGTELLCDGTLGKLGSTQQEVVEILRVSGLELEQRIENLLTFSAWQQSKATLTVGVFDLATLVDSVIDNHRLEIVTKELKVTKKVPDVTLLADREKLRMAVDNLVSNAVKYSPRGGRIGIRVTRKSGQVALDVVDEGPGIAAKERERIFEPFFQGKAPEGRHVRGTGIGLSVVRECVEAHGGRIAVLPRHSPGAHFRITLPLNHEIRAA
ncbi:MAG: ATP-binding protein [Gammaproteobacteria bacterium]|nr:ATP-binding protein [Gammaproteobacteria bacterium]